MGKTVKAWLCVMTIVISQPLLAQHKKEMKGDIDEVVVTGTGTRHVVKDAPVETQVITHRMLENYGGASLSDILNGLCSTFDFSEGDMGAQMQMGGLSNSYILILVDGKRMHGDVGGQNDLGLVDPHNIERIEIVKGAASALYGSDAIAGVINIITKKHDDQGLMLENTTRYGSYNDWRQHNGISMQWGKLQSYTNFQLQHTDGWQNTSEEWAEGQVITDSKNKTVNEYTNVQLSERLNYAFTDRLSAYAEGAYYWKRIYRPQDGTHASCDVYTYDLMYHNNSAAIGGKMQLNKTDYLTLDVNWDQHAYYYKYTNTTLEEGYDIHGNVDPTSNTLFPFFAGQRNLQSDQQRAMAHLKGIFALPYGNNLSVGAEYRYDYLHAPTRVHGSYGSDWTAALYAQDEFSLLKWLQVTAGLRLNQNGNFGFHATPKLSAMLSLGDLRLRAGWSAGFKAPTPKELHYHYLRSMGEKVFYYMGNTNLKPQTSSYWSLNAEYRKNRFALSLTGYLNRLDNMITLVNVTKNDIPKDIITEYFGDGSADITPRQYKNMEDARTCGLDATASVDILNGLTAGASYSYLDTRAHIYNDSHHKLIDVTIDGMAHHKGSAYVTYNHRFTPDYRLGVGLYAKASSKRYYQNDGNGRGYCTWRLTTQHDLGHSKHLAYRIEAGIDNIFNYKDTAWHGHHLGTTTAGRTLYATFSIKYKEGKTLKNNIKQIKNDED